MRTGTPITTGLRLCATLAACVLMSGGSVPLAYAAETPVPDPPPSNSTTYTLSPDQFSLTISPTRLVVSPADIAKTAKFQVVNRGQAAVSVAVQARNFIGGVDGSLDYRDDAPYAAASWMTLSPVNFTVAPGATQIVTAAIAVPPAPEPGDHQVAMVFLVPAGETTDNIKINRGVGAPLYITVPGPTDDSATLSGLTAPGFVLRGPVDISATVHDTGTVHRDFRGTTPLVIDAAGARAAFPDFTVLRGGSRDISTTWDPPLVCICNPTVSFTNADGTVQTATVRVVVLPLDLLGAVIVGAALIVLGLRWQRRRYRASVLAAAARLGTGGAGSDG